MNAERIDLYKAVQGRRGEWRIGDRVHHLIRGPGIVMADHGTLGIVDGRKYVGVDFNRPTYAVMPADDPDLIWLPPVWSEDERCLVHMIEDDFTITRIWYDSDDLTTDDGYIYGVDIIGGEFIGYYNTLPEALLRAIREQEANHE